MESIKQVLRIGFGSVFDAEIIDDKCEGEGLGVVLPETGYDWDGSISMGFKELGEAIVCNAAGLEKAIHAYSNFYMNETEGMGQSSGPR
jgi:hypothetical protein